MNPERIEEFRKKLRAGQQAEVNGGVVRFRGDAPAAASPGNGQPSPAGTPGQHPTPSARGVQVKPHEWGAR